MLPFPTLICCWIWAFWCALFQKKINNTATAALYGCFFSLIIFQYTTNRANATLKSQNHFYASPEWPLYFSLPSISPPFIGSHESRGWIRGSISELSRPRRRWKHSTLIIITYIFITDWSRRPRRPFSNGNYRFWCINCKCAENTTDWRSFTRELDDHGTCSLSSDDVTQQTIFSAMILHEQQFSMNTFSYKQLSHCFVSSVDASKDYPFTKKKHSLLIQILLLYWSWSLPTLIPLDCTLSLFPSTHLTSILLRPPADLPRWSS